MQKLIKGILDFRKRLLPERLELFAELAKGQHPDTLFITCSDSRVAPNWFASTDPGDLFVIRNVGNLVSPCGRDGRTTGDESEMAAVEFALQSLKVSDIIVCGHSGCGAMQAILSGQGLEDCPHLRSWLQNGREAHKKLEQGLHWDPSLSKVDQLSQLNVLQQLENLKTYPLVQKRFEEGRLRMHAWWFNIATAEVFAYEPEKSRFSLICE